MLYLILVLLFTGAMLIYFRVADKYNIIDKPNERSSHTELTIRGGGIVILMAVSIIGIIFPAYWDVVGGAIIIGVVSFLDDRIELSSRIRLVFHLIAVTLMFFNLGVFQLFSWYIYIALFILVIGVINAYNFMDGINGITGLYSLIVLCGLQYINFNVVPFAEADLIWLPVLGCLVFLFFNFREKAKCFAGDVGSITMAFWIAFLLLKLTFVSQNFGYVLFLLIYGLDAATTIIFRLFRKENIFEAHRSHFYQYLANEKKISHRYVALGYAIAQLIVIILMIRFSIVDLNMIIMIVVLSVLVFVALRFFLEGKIRLLGRL